MRLNLHIAPAVEPIVAGDLEIHSRLGTGNIAALGETAAVALFISAIRQRCEAITRRQLITASWDLVLDGFPGAREPIEIPLPPLQSVTSIT
ncbi:MAG: head-tail connector protein [Candidatus Nanopelagicales bacterium]